VIRQTVANQCRTPCLPPKRHDDWRVGHRTWGRTATVIRLTCSLTDLARWLFSLYPFCLAPRFSSFPTNQRARPTAFGPLRRRNRPIAPPTRLHIHLPILIQRCLFSSVHTRTRGQSSLLTTIGLLYWLDSGHFPPLVSITYSCLYGAPATTSTYWYVLAYILLGY
jgi:hypothetical protein